MESLIDTLINWVNDFDERKPTSWERWLIGIITSAFVLLLGSYAAITGHAAFPNVASRRRFSLLRGSGPRADWIEWYGDEAISLGLALVFFAVAVHVVFFWRQTERDKRIGNRIAASAMILSLMSTVYFLASGFLF